MEWTAIDQAALGTGRYQTQVGQLMPVERNPAGARSSSAADVRAAFNSFIGQTFFGQLLHAMRTSLGQPAYFHGGQAEAIFQSQLDDVLAEQMTQHSAEAFADPMFARQFPQLAESLDRDPPRPERSASLTNLATRQRY
ncbi:MAG: hypothetical protein A2W31_10025 [Planctomycetes bacterium RBG_16_64_10]|nr:MAG: hypothetical protein A2W31_10025 [Planctomycetes bacterium RBG_16_64_10]